MNSHDKKVCQRNNSHFTVYDRQEMMGDEELDEILHNVFGDDSDEDDMM